MQSSIRHARPQKQRRSSGYEPSDTETERHEIPSRDRQRKNLTLALVDEPEPDPERNTSPLKLRLRNNSKAEEFDSVSVANSKTSRKNKSPYRKNRDDTAASQYPRPSLEFRRHLSPLPKTERLSPIKNKTEDRKPEPESNQSRRTPTSHSRRSATAPRLRIKETNDQQQQRSPQPPSSRRNLTRSQTSKPPTGGEINEMVANVKLSRIQGNSNNKNVQAIMDSTESIQAGDIFFSREVTAPAKQSNPNSVKNRAFETTITASSPIFTEPPNLRTNMNRNPSQRSRNPSSSSVPTSRPVNGKLSRGGSSNASIYSGSSSISMGIFTAERRRKKSQGEPWFACGRNGSCAKSRRTPEKERFDEASFIERAFIVEKLRPFWADKYQPTSLAGLTCHKQEALLLRQIASSSNIPHILFKGPYGSGKRALTMGFLSQIYGDQCFNLSHELRHFQVQEKRPVDVIVPLTSSAHHVELNVHLEANARYALMGIVKEISNNHDMTPEMSTLNFRPDYKLIVLREVDRGGESIQHMIKWIMDCYADSCKLILCCEDDGDILESVKNRCKVIKVDAPITHEIMEVLIQIARKEEFDLPMSFAAKIATKSKQNMRKAIMALEACKAHNYPFSDDQPIQIGWEDVLVELAAEILSDPSPKRLFFVRGKFQKLLVDFVHPKLILQKLVEQFLKGISSDLKREVYYWHAYYDKRLPTGSTALLKLEEFVAKFMSIYRKTTNNNHLKDANNRSRR